MEFKKSKSKQNLQRLNSIDELSVKLEQKLNIKPLEVSDISIQNRQHTTEKYKKLIDTVGFPSGLFCQ